MLRTLEPVSGHATLKEDNSLRHDIYKRLQISNTPFHYVFPVRLITFIVTQSVFLCEDFSLFLCLAVFHFVNDNTLKSLMISLYLRLICYLGVLSVSPFTGLYSELVLMYT